MSTEALSIIALIVVAGLVVSIVYYFKRIDRK